MDEALKELKRATKELAIASAQLSERVIQKAGAAAKEPKETVHRATATAARELDAAAKEIQRILRSL